MRNMSGELAKAFRHVHVDPRILWPALTVALGYYVAARLGLAFTLQPHPISTLWPPNALLMAALLLMPARTWWWLPAAAPARRAAERRAARHGARLVCKQLQRGADRRGAGACLRARAAAPGFAAQHRCLPPLRRARRAPWLFVPRRGPGEADRLRRGRVLDVGAHALLVQRAGRADGGAAGADLGHLPGRGPARRAAAALPRDRSGVPRRAGDQPRGLRPAAVRRQHRAGAVLRAAAVPAVGRGASGHHRHRERARGDGGGDDLRRGQRPGPVRRRLAAGHGARHAALPDRGFGAAATAGGGARGARQRG